jgi:hypothetical protein
MRILPLTVCALVFALPAKADKFWLSDPAAQKTASAGSSPEVVDGVLISEDADNYHVRVAGGELVLPKKAVFKIEKDDLTIETIVKGEKDSAEKLALANRERVLKQQIAQKERDVRVAEASAKRSDRKAADASAKVEPAAAPVAGFDPVIGRAIGPAIDPVREALLAYELTRDRAYLRLARQMRRDR